LTFIARASFDLTKNHRKFLRRLDSELFPRLSPPQNARNSLGSGTFPPRSMRKGTHLHSPAGMTGACALLRRPWAASKNSTASLISALIPVADHPVEDLGPVTGCWCYPQHFPYRIVYRVSGRVVTVSLSSEHYSLIIWYWGTVDAAQ
jgi:hypothetical protein